MVSMVPHGERLLCDRGAVVWLTGLSGAGKSTVGFHLEQRLVADGYQAFLLDGDDVRRGLCRDLGYSEADRVENVRRVGEVAALMADAGVIVIACFISPYRVGREIARRTVGARRFFEIFLDTPIEICEARDPKGLYRKARAGQIQNFTGVSSPYETPLEPALKIHDETVADSSDRLVALLRERGFLPAYG